MRSALRHFSPDRHLGRASKQYRGHMWREAIHSVIAGEYAFYAIQLLFRRPLTARTIVRMGAV